MNLYKNSIRLHRAIYLIMTLLLSSPVVEAATMLADQPLFSGSAVTGNVALDLSVEFPTALGSAYTSAYAPATNYIGYFDPNKCYLYDSTNASVSRHYFYPTGAATAHVCSGMWSGNFLNWALTQTIDPFRYVLTGGYRSIDEVGLTTLEKAWASGQGGTVATPNITGAATVAGATPFNFTTFTIRINGLGNQFYFTSTGSLSGTPVAENPAKPLASKVYSMYARVKVCDSAFLESNCTAYGTNYKPTGLIQTNALKLNFAAFGYLNDGNLLRDGGVLRAQMAQLGPMMSVPNAPDVVNPNPEWDANTGVFITNPDPAAATASGVSNSGVINYLNKFGLTAPGYKQFDPVSELYYTSIRYFKNQGNVASYTSGANTAMVDGFPVITAWNDPIKYSCQANFIIGIGDTNTHADANLPGSTINSTAKEPAVPPEVTADFADLRTTGNPNGKGVDVRLATNMVGQLEGINSLGLGNLGEFYIPWCCGNNSTFFMAGLAYDSHTVDMRPDLAGNQTVTTYWLDVLESGDRKDYSVVGMRNQFWLTAKYGGFTNIPANYNAYTATTGPAVANWDANGDGDPDNYFRANNPALMITGLTNAFKSIINSISRSSNAFALTSPAVTNGTMSYATSYTSAGWIGDVIASTSTVSGAVVTTTPAWNAATKLETQTAGAGWDTGRFIATAKCVAGSAGQQTCTAIPFRLANLSTAQSTALGTTNTQSTLNFLRGDRSNEGSSGSALYRTRIKILGDIANSKVVPVGPPSEAYTDTFNPGYTAFASTYASRATVAYVGANDGMLHAFNGAATGGNELFAYVPNALYQGPNNTPAVDGLLQLSNSNYLHHYYVDATPIIRDVNFGASSSDWHSLLISGLGKGGKSYFAIDVTNPATMTTEALVAAQVKWEFTHQDMGFTYDTPLIVKTAKDGWVAVLTSGYNNTDGKGYFFIVKLSDGSLIQEIPVNDLTQSAGTDAGLAHVGPFISNKNSGIADAAYAGDLLGNVWRLDLTATTGTYAAPIKIAQLTAADGTAQPVTVAPIVEVDVNTSKRYVFVGTGKLLANPDVGNTQLQDFYAINDGTSAAFSNIGTLPSGVSYPIQRSNLTNNTNTLLTGIGSAPAQPMGYYIDLGAGPTGVPYRVNVDMNSAVGLIGFAANLTAGDACNPSGSNQTYVLQVGTGKSAIVVGGAVVANLNGVGSATSIVFYQTNDGTSKSVQFTTTNDAGQAATGTGIDTSYLKNKQLNWRELPTLN